MIKIIFISITISIFGGLIVNAAVASQVPRLQDSGIDFSKISTITQKHQLAILHESKPMEIVIDDEKERVDVRFVSAIATIDAPIEQVRSTILDFSRYKEYMPQLKKSNVRKNDKSGVVVDFKLKFLLPIIKVNLDYTLRYQEEENGDIVWDYVEGDIEGNMGRWELVPLSKNTTMVIYTVWNDMRSMGFWVRMVLNAQPDLEVAMPISTTALVVDALKKELEKTLKESAPKSMFTKSSRPPQISELGVSATTFKSLAKIGTLMLIHPKQQIPKKEGSDPVDLLFISAGRVVQVPIEKAKAMTLKFDRYHEFFDQVDEVDVKEIGGNIVADWELELGFGVISIGVDYVLEYNWRNKNTLDFSRLSGDIEYIHGSWEWFSLDNETTLFFYTNASVVGDEAGMILKLANLIPNKDLVLGSSAAAVLAENQAPWIEENAK